ncbi:MAG: hypothetical protein AAGC80_26305 [Rhodococcus sp. (in: high G+C Gram-positive bacteria)]
MNGNAAMSGTGGRNGQCRRTIDKNAVSGLASDHKTWANDQYSITAIADAAPGLRGIAVPVAPTRCPIESCFSTASEHPRCTEF